MKRIAATAVAILAVAFAACGRDATVNNEPNGPSLVLGPATGLEATKSAFTEYTATYEWAIDKYADITAHEGYPGQSFTSWYSIELDQTVNESDFKVLGMITITNPTEYQVDFDVSDDVAGTAASVSCDSYSVSPYAGLSCEYSATLSEKIDGTNTATITSNTADVEGTTASENYYFNDPTNTLGEQAVSLSDSYVGPFPWSYTGDETVQYSRKFTCSSSADDYTNGVDEDVYKNTVTIDQTGQTADATVTVTCRASFGELLKTTNGSVDQTKDIRFKLYDADGTDLSDEVSTLNDADGKLQFQNALVPGASYTVCESPVPAAYTFVVVNEGAVLTYAGPPGTQNPTGEIQCFDFVAAESPTTKIFAVDNSYPGGGPRTPGYWKNWSTCTRGNQSATAARLGGVPEGIYLLNNLLPQTVGELAVNSCQIGVYVLDARWATGTQAGKQASSDAGYILARSYLAARLNQEAGACVPTGTGMTKNGGGQTFEQVLTAAQEFLVKIGYDGNGTLLTSKSGAAADRQYALFLYGILNAYNNGALCTGEPSH